MSFNLLAINVGNTRSQLACVVDGEMGQVYYAAHDQPDALDKQLKAAVAGLGEAREAGVLLASVNEPVAGKVAQRINALMGDVIERVERDVNVPIGRRLDPETLVGVDRLLNAAAGYDQLKQACVVVDAGTAVTVDFVDGDGTFHGGAILPGARMMLRAMHEHTAALPEIELAAPSEPIGHSTAQAMLTGVYHGIRGAVRELVETFAEQYGAYPAIIATGGDAELLFGNYELIETIVPDLTLRGLVVTRRYQVEQTNE